MRKVAEERVRYMRINISNIILKSKCKNGLKCRSFVRGDKRRVLNLEDRVDPALCTMLSACGCVEAEGACSASEEEEALRSEEERAVATSQVGEGQSELGCERHCR